ncbi:MAG: glutathione S-transferase family protein [Acidobacteriota bacterium]|jgi:glutathione S-transferase
MLTLYDNAVSGNAYKVRLMLAHLDLPYERIELSVTDRSNREEVLGDKNPALRIPTLQLDDGRWLGESNAIMHYLAEGTPYLPDGRYERAETLQWMFFEQYDHEPNVAVARFLLHYVDDPTAHVDTIAAKQQLGRKAIGAMERRLREHDFLAADRYTIADIALYAYTHVADEAGIDLAEFPDVQTWIERVAAQPGHVRITD